MNMISTGAFLNEMDASNKQERISEKFVRVWENKNAKAARAGGVSLMALSLAACGSSSSTTTSTSTSTDTTTTTVTPVSSAFTVGNDALTGTAGNDTFTGARSDSIQTWTGGDTVSGGAGTDTLSATLTANVAPADGGITGVENLTVTALTNNVTITASTATVSGIDGVTHLTNVGSATNLTVTRMLDLAEVTVNNTSGDTTVTYNDALLTGSSDAVTLNVNGNTGAVNLGDSTGNGDAIETLTINATGATSTFDGTGLDATATTLNLTGSALLDLDANDLFAKLGTLNASESTGGVRVAIAADTVSGATNTKTITGGSGNDIFDIDAVVASTVGAVSVSGGAGNDTIILGAQGASDYTLDGGAGTDKISISGDTAAATHIGVTGFEELIVTTAIGAAATNTLNMALLPTTNSFTTLYANVTTGDNDSDGSETVSFTNVGAGVTTLKLGALDTNDLNVTVDRLVDGSADTLTVAPQANSAQGTLNIADAETITFNTADGSFTASTGVTATDATSITVVGDNNAALGTVSGTKVATVDVSGLTGAATFSGVFSSSTAVMTVTGNSASTYTGTMTITTGTANDNITGSYGADNITGGAGNDTIDGGAGADTITGGTGSDTITGGAGVDIFTFQTSGGGIDSITDFTANSTNSSDDRIALDILGAAGADATDVHESNSGGTLLDDGDVLVLNGASYIDVSGNAAADKTAILASGGGITQDASSDAIYIFKADTDGDGTADAVQMWLTTAAAGDTTIDTVTHIATFTGYSTTADLASDFAVGDFDL